MARLIVHCKKEKYDVYIGRAVSRSGLKSSVGAIPSWPAKTEREKK